MLPTPLCGTAEVHAAMSALSPRSRRGPDFGMSTIASRERLFRGNDFRSMGAQKGWQWLFGWSNCGRNVRASSDAGQRRKIVSEFIGERVAVRPNRKMG